MADVQLRSKKRKRGGRSRRKEKEDCSPAANNLSVFVSSSTCASSIVKSASKSSSSFLDKMKTKLSGGCFRMINEKLYTCSGDEALSYFKEDPALFNVFPVSFRVPRANVPLACPTK